MRKLVTIVAAALLGLLFTGCVRRVVLPPQEPLGEDPPPGMVDLKVVSEYGNQTWDVHAGGEVVCSTPCTQRLRIGEDLVLVAGDGDELFVPAVAIETPDTKRALLIAEGSHRGKRVNGIVFTTLGGMAMVTGITFTAVGCSNLQERAGMCTAGLITAGVGLPLTAVSIWLIVDALPKSHFMPVAQVKTLDGHPPVRVSLAPNGIAGTF